MQSSFNGAAVGDGRACKGAEVGAVFSNTGQRSNVINVSFVVVNQVGNGGDEVSVIVDSSSQLVQGVEQGRGTINQIRDSSSTVAAFSLNSGFQGLKSSLDGLVVING